MVVQFRVIDFLLSDNTEFLALRAENAHTQSTWRPIAQARKRKGIAPRNLIDDDGKRPIVPPILAADSRGRGRGSGRDDNDDDNDESVIAVLEQ